MTVDSVDAPPRWHALSFVPPGTHCLLDVGCNEGAFLSDAHRRGVRSLRGIEINPHILEETKKNLAHIPDVQLFQGSAETIPLPDQSVEVATCLEVLEHIPEEMRPEVIEEISRVLKPHGRLIVTVPANGIFRFLDPANVRFVFPRFFALVSRWVGGTGREAGYENQKHGVTWHHHFSMEELARLFSQHFEMEHKLWRGVLLSPICASLEFPFYRLKRTENVLFRTIRRIHVWDHSLNCGELLGYNVLVTFRKK